MMSDTEVTFGEAFRLRRHFKLVAHSGAFCDLSMEAGFMGDDAAASILRVTPKISDHQSRRDGQVVEVTLDDDGKGSATLALPVGGEAINFAADFEVREDLGNRVTVTLSGEGIEPYTDEFFVTDLRPEVEPTPAMPSLVERAQLPPGTIVDEGFPFSVDPLAPNGRDSMGNPLADFGKPGAHEEHAPTGTEPVGSGNTDMCPC